MANVGGWSETKDATKEIQNLCNQVKLEVEKRTGLDYKVYKALKYRDQLVAGENYLIKVDVGADCLHLLLFQKLPCEGGQVEVLNVEQHKRRDDPLIPPF
ncbi:stefin-C-like [Plectropomus leopardus]|uniref:stefin-C-like n=1 Tax=Plectropomus leopardus TaxID=160734 RepID=UPI001C4CA850|nr:stefin-C-like [Plectropomus leopardus]